MNDKIEYTNLYSLSTYINMIKDAKTYENMYYITENKEERYNYLEKKNDKYLTYTINLNKNSTDVDSNFEYSSMFNAGLKITKIDIILVNNVIKNILVYTKNDEVYLSIEYENITFNNEIDENIFNI